MVGARGVSKFFTSFYFVVILLEDGSTQECNSTLMNTSGTIYSIDGDGDGHYEPNLDCWWTIEAEVGHVIKINIAEFYVQYGSICEYDSLEIYDGSKDETDLLGRFCNWTPPPTNYISRSNILHLRFQTNAWVSYSGFRIVYDIIKDPCGGILDQNFGTFKSVDRNLDGNYENDDHCLWNITVANGTTVQLKFLDMDIRGDNQMCLQDYIKVYDGSVSNDSLISTVCGSDRPEPISCKSNQLYVLFHTDASWTGEGFIAVYGYTGQSLDCGFSTNLTYGWIGPQLSTVDGFYDNNLDCTWYVTSVGINVIDMTFIYNEIEPNNEKCDLDFLEVYDGDMFHGPYCDANHPPMRMTTKENNLQVHFVTDSTVGASGFNITYIVSEVVIQFCGEIMANLSGELHAPGSVNGGLYDHNMDCSWIIQVEQGGRIELKLLDIDIEESESCRYDFLQIRDGNNTESPLIGTFCGKYTTHSIFLSSSNTIYMRFSSDASIHGAGFTAHYGQITETKFDCGFTITDTFGSFGPGDIDKDGLYDKSLNCSWTIMAQPNRTVHLLIQNLDIENSDGCIFDSLKISDLGSEIKDLELLGTLCDKIKQQKYKSSYGLYIQFQSDASIMGTGFNVTYYQAYSIEERRWPSGDYSILMSKYGCPDPDINDWKYGYVNVSFRNDVEFEGVDNLMGPFSRRNLQLTFCTMTPDDADWVREVTADWPQGNFSVFAGQSGCPDGFNSYDQEFVLFKEATHIVANGYLPELLISDPLPSEDYMFIRMDITASLCEVTSEVYNLEDQLRFPFILLAKHSPALRANGSMNMFEIVPKIKIHGDFYVRMQGILGSHVLLTLIPTDIGLLFQESKEFYSPKDTTWALGVPDQIADDESWFLYDLGHSVAVSALRFVTAITGSNNSALEGNLIDEVKMSETKWNLKNGSINCLANTERSEWVLMIHCLNQPSGRYMMIMSNSSAMLGQILEYTLTIWIHSNKESQRCNKPLGMRDGSIADFQIMTSSEQNSYPAHHARPGYSSWCSKADDNQPFFQIDLLKNTVVDGIQIFNAKKEFIASEGIFSIVVDAFSKGKQIYDVSYKVDGNGRFVNQGRYQMDHNLPLEAGQTFIFANAVNARHWKVQMPLDLWTKDLFFEIVTGSICLQFELLGCKTFGTKTMQCSANNNSMVAHTEKAMISKYYDKLISNSSENCMTRCRELSQLCSTAIYNKDQNLCTWYEENSIGSYMSRALDEVTMESVMRVCLADATNERLTSFLQEGIDWQSITTTVNQDSSIFSHGYPFHYQRGQTWVWDVNFGQLEYVNYQMVNFSFDIKAHDDPTKDKIRFTDKINRLYVTNDKFDVASLLTDSTVESKEGILKVFAREEINNYFHIRTNENRLLIILRTFEYESSVKQFGTGFRMITYATGIPTCFAGQICMWKTASIMPRSFLGDAPDYILEKWTIQTVSTEYITLVVDNFDISCTGRSFMEIEFTVDSKRRYCNYNRPIDTIMSTVTSLVIHFQFSRATNMLSEYFSAMYSVEKRNQSLNFLLTEEEIVHLDLGGMAQTATKVCSEHFKKCYLLLNVYEEQEPIKRKTWNDLGYGVCEKYGWSLISIHTKDENDFMGELLLQRYYDVDNRHTYIGLQRQISAKDSFTYVWSDKSPVTYTSWLVGHPIPTLPCTRMVLSLHGEHVWESIPCDKPMANMAICSSAYATERSTTEGVQFEPEQSNTNASSFLGNLENTNYFSCGDEEVISLIGKCNGFVDCSNGEDELNCEKSPETGSCNAKQFQCGDGQCISISQLCDFINDCSDGSDENCYFPLCEMDEFRCNNSQCIAQNELCDGKDDCTDGSDERQRDCIFDNCNSGTSFLCGLTKCIPLMFVCDGVPDCWDSQDEIGCNKLNSCEDWWAAGYNISGIYQTVVGKVECNFDQVLINNMVITRYHNIDHGRYLDSYFGATFSYQDEANLLGLYNSSNCYQSVEQGCQPWINQQYDIERGLLDHYTNACSCLRYTKHLSAATVSDTGYVGLCEDELSTAFYNESYHLEIEHDSTYWHIKSVNLKQDHTFSVDEMLLKLNPISCYSDFVPLDIGIACRNGLTTSQENRCLYALDQYNHIVGCRSLEHLQDCVAEIRFNIETLPAASVAIHLTNKNNNKCTDWTWPQESWLCPPDYFKCTNSFCLAERFVCDGTAQCMFGEDEKHCGKRHCKNQYRCLQSNVCLSQKFLCDGYRHCPLGDDERMCRFQCPEDCICEGYTVDCTHSYPYNKSELSISPNTRLLDMSQNPLLYTHLNLDDHNAHKLAHLNLSACGIYNISNNFLANMKNLIVLDISYNHIETIAFETFINQVRLQVLRLDGNTELMYIESNAFSGLHAMSYLNLTDLRIQHIKRAAFSSLDLKKLTIDRSLVFLLDNHVFEKLSVDILSFKSEIVSFSEDMFAGIEYVDTVITDAYKFCCIKPDFLPESNCFPQKDEFSSCEDLMRNEILRVLIWIIGLFALFGNCLSLIYRVVYDKKRLRMSYGIFVSNLAVSDFLMGIYLIIIASADVHFRGKYIYESEEWKASVWCKLAGILSAMSSECSVLLMCLITLDRIFVIKFPFGQIRIRQKLAWILVTGVWIAVFIISILPILYTSYFKESFYSKSGVCLALPLTRDKPPGWQYAVGLFIGFNSITFLLIALGQYMIYNEIRLSKKTIAGKRSTRTNDLKIARNLLLVVSTDFLCWFPIGILGAMALSGHVIPSDVYAWTAVIVLPINSALNPFLYTLSAIMGAKKFVPDSGEQSHVIVYSKDELSQSLSLWQKSRFVTSRHYRGVPLEHMLESKRVRPRLCAAIAVDILKSLTILHENGLFQENFALDDLCLTKDKQGRIRVVMKCRPKLKAKSKALEVAENMEKIGQICEKMTSRCKLKRSDTSE